MPSAFLKCAFEEINKVFFLSPLTWTQFTTSSNAFRSIWNALFSLDANNCSFTAQNFVDAVYSKRNCLPSGLWPHEKSKTLGAVLMKQRFRGCMGCWCGSWKEWEYFSLEAVNWKHFYRVDFKLYGFKNICDINDYFFKYLWQYCMLFLLCIPGICNHNLIIFNM